MATYSTIKGFTIQSLATDPVATAVEAGTWASGGVRNNPLYDGTGCGTQTAALACLGTGGSGPTPGNQAKTEEYNGTAWTEVTDAPTAVRVTAGAGIQTSAVFASGYGVSLATESYVYDGTNWTEGGDITQGREGASGAGSSNTAAIIVGGSGPPGRLTLTEEYNGTIWTEKADLNVAKENAAGIGTSTAALVVAGNPSPTATVEEWNGTSWTEVGDINTARQNPAQNGAGTTTLALIAGGTPPVTANTEAYNGTAWTEVADMATARSASYGGGTQTAAISSGGGPPPGNVTATEEFTVPATASVAQEGQVWYNTTSTVLKGFGQFLASVTWASGAGMAAYANGIRGFGTQTAAIGVGFYGPSTPLSYTYNGSAWSSINGLVNAPGRYYPGGTGTTTAGICFGGEPGKNESETYDGTSWTEGNNLTTGRNFMASGGTSTAAFGAAGYAPGYTGKTEIWNGTSWSEDADVPVGVQGPGGNGSVTAAIIYSGIIASPSTTTAITYTFDGTTWSDASADVNTECSMFGSAGPQTGNTAALKFGGETHPGKTVNTELYDGSTWTEVANIANGRRSFGGAGTTASALFFGGEPPSGAGLTEEWSVTPSIKTFTAS